MYLALALIILSDTNRIFDLELRIMNHLSINVRPQSDNDNTFYLMQTISNKMHHVEYEIMYRYKFMNCRNNLLYKLYSFQNKNINWIR